MSEYIQKELSNPQDEYSKLCGIFFGTTDQTVCNAQTTDARKNIPSSRTTGLFPYMQGLLKQESGFSYAEAEQKFGPQLRQLKGASLYLAGTGQCVKGNDSLCFTLKTEPSKDKQIFDFIDDIYNLVGAFEFLRKDFADGSAPKSCIIGAQTFGTEKAPFCHMFYSHNLFATPYTWAIRSVPSSDPQGKSSCQ